MYYKEAKRQREERYRGKRQRGRERGIEVIRSRLEFSLTCWNYYCPLLPLPVDPLSVPCNTLLLYAVK